MDRMWASRLGCPPAIQDEDVKVDLPSNPIVNGKLPEDLSDASYYASYAKLANITTNVVRSIYNERDATTTLFGKIQQRLKELKAWTIILATRPTLLYGLRLHTSRTSPTHKQTIPPSAKTLIDACIRCARHSVRILSDSWINGAFPALYHDLTQYLFSALTVLAVSSLLGHADSAGDRDGFEDAVQLLAQGP
ncbi:hypothetical protein N0V88_006822 [Collariella sp. IMI 366227]|nr:hypothetical protein N0V88_006822 [Collariella sp. IMI 366227]